MQQKFPKDGDDTQNKKQSLTKNPPPPPLGIKTIRKIEMKRKQTRDALMDHISK